MKCLYSIIFICHVYFVGTFTEMCIRDRRIGVMGSSAGGHLSAMASNDFDKRTYPAVDAADKASCRCV